MNGVKGGTPVPPFSVANQGLGIRSVALIIALALTK